MESLVYLAHTLSPLAAGLLIASIWQGLLLTAVAAVALRALPELSPSARTRVWTAVLLLLLLLPLLNLLLPHSASPTHVQLHIAQNWSFGLLALWIVLAAGRAVALTANAFRLWRLAAGAVPVSVPSSVLPLLEGSRRATLCATAAIDRPSVAGYFRPRILLPQGLLENLSPAELEHVVLHEMEHLRRRDDWMNLLQQISLVLLPLNPALFWLDRRLCRERELACDDGVLAATQARKAYAACLVKLAEDSLLRKGFALALSALGTRAHESDLVNRVRRILAGPEALTAIGNRRSLTATLSLAALALTALLARSPQWVSFDASPVAMAQAAEPLTTLSPSFAGRMVRASATMNASATARPMMTSAVLEQRPVTAVSVQRTWTPTSARHRKVRTQMLPVRANSQAKRPWVAAPFRSGARMSRPWSTTPVSAVGYSIPNAEKTPDQTANPAAHLIVTEFELPQPIYAAVPVRGGWLILQL